MTTCSATKKDGTPCTGKAVKNGLCLSHQPRMPKPASIPMASISASARSAPAAAPGSVDPAVQARIHAVAVMPAAMLCLFLPLAYRPAAQEIDAILIPLERILIRHTPALEGLNDDVADALAAAAGACSYVGRAFIQPWIVRSFQPAAPTAGRPGAAVPPGSGSVQPGGGYVGVTPAAPAAAAGAAPGLAGYSAGQAPADRNGHTPGARPTLEDTLAHIHASALVDRRDDADESLDDDQESYQ